MRAFLILAALFVLTGCAPLAPANNSATEAVMAARIFATLTAAAPAVTPAAAKATPTLPASPGTPICRVNSDSVRLRPGPGTAYAPPLASLKAGTLLIPIAYVPVGDPDGAWIQVRLAAGPATGWVSAALADCSVDPASLPAAALPATALPTRVAASATPTGTPRPHATTASPTPTPTSAVLPPGDTSTPTASPTASPTPAASPTATVTPTPYPPVPQVSLTGAFPNGIAVDPERGNVFITGRDTNMVYVLAPSLTVIKRIPVGKQPWGITYMSGYIHVANYGSGSVTVIDAASLQTISNPPGHGPAPESASIQNEISAPTFIAADPPLGRVAVSLHGPQEVYHRYVYMYGLTAEGGLGNWASVNGLPEGAFGIATLPSFGRAYVANPDARTLTAVDIAAAALVQNESLAGLPFSPYLVAALDATKTVYVTNSPPEQPDGPPQQVTQYLVLPGQAPKYVKSVTVGEMSPGGGAIGIYPWRDDMMRPGSPYDGSVWVGSRDRVTVFDPTLVEQRSSGRADGIVGLPSAIAADPVLRRVYVAEGQTGRIVVLAGW